MNQLYTRKLLNLRTVYSLQTVKLLELNRISLGLFRFLPYFHEGLKQIPLGNFPMEGKLIEQETQQKIYEPFLTSSITPGF